MTRHRSILAACLFAVTLPAVAAAGSAPTRHPFDRVGAGASVLLGAGSPLGLLGIEGHLDLRSHAYLSGGVGLGPAPQVAAMGHLRQVLGADRVVALSAGYGISYGKHYWSEGFCFESSCASKAGYVYWHNAELSLELRPPVQPGTIALVSRVFGGVAVAGNPGNLQCTSSDVHHCETAHADDGGGPLPYLGVTIGVLF
jgi:hypothetical protein